MAAAPETTGPHVMACMEVWGGNRAIDNGVVMPGLDAWVFSLPFQGGGGRGGVGGSGSGGVEAGGDIHFVTSCATGRITRLIVADVSGHGAPVARAADALRRLMRKHSNYIDQTKFVRAVNAEFGQIAEARGGETEDSSAGVLFATAVVATYFSPTDELAVSSAGHPRPMRFEASRAEWSVVESDEGEKRATQSVSGAESPTNLPLGIVADARYPARTIRLRSDDLVLFYTDSLIEAKGPDGRLLGYEGLRRALAQGDPARPESFIRELLGRIAAGAEPAGGGSADIGETFNDDVTALLVRRNALKPRPSLGLAIMAGIRIARETIRSILPGAPPTSIPELSRRSIAGAMSEGMNKRNGGPT